MLGHYCGRPKAWLVGLRQKMPPRRRLVGDSCQHPTVLTALFTPVWNRPPGERMTGPFRTLVGRAILECISETSTRLSGFIEVTKRAHRRHGGSVGHCHTPERGLGVRLPFRVGQTYSRREVRCLAGAFPSRRGWRLGYWVYAVLRYLVHLLPYRHSGPNRS